MIRLVRVQSALAVAALALGAAAVPARAQPGAGEAAGAGPRGLPASRGVPGGHLWWNDPAVAEKLSLSVDQRLRMDELYRGFRRESEARGDLARKRDEFLAELREGDLARARAALAAWADAENAELRGRGTLRIEVLALLDAEQQKKLGVLEPDVVAAPWSPRPTWIHRPPQPRAAPRKRPAPAP